MIVLVTILQLSRCMGCLCSGNNTGTISAVKHHPVCCFLFSCHKKTLWQNVFTLFLMISNLANLAVIFIKDHRKSFSSLTSPYKVTAGLFSLMLAVVEIILAIPLFFYMKKVYTPAVEKEPSGFEWRYFVGNSCHLYVMWYYAFYGNASKSSLEIAPASEKYAVFIYLSMSVPFSFTMSLHA